jgi:hypothetical protein
VAASRTSRPSSGGGRLEQTSDAADPDGWNRGDVDAWLEGVFEFEDGLARRVRAYLDPQEAREAVGLR